jgi:hypothetical protein
MDPRACRRHEGVTSPDSTGPSPEQSGGPAFCKTRSAGFSVWEVDDERGLAFLRDRLRDLFGGFPGRVVAEFLPNAGANDPVVEVVVRDNVNSSGCHRLSSAKRNDWQRIGEGAVTSVNFGAIEKSEEADSRQWVFAPRAARWRVRNLKP